MNLFYVAVDPSLYTHYSTGKAYPHAMCPYPNNVNDVPNFTTCTNNNECAAAKIMQSVLLKMQNKIVNMNAALINNLLSLIPMAFKLLYKQEQIMNPNAVFQIFFDWFVIKYGHTSAKDRKTNWMAMAADWHPLMGFEVLTLRLFCSITFASLSGHPFTDKDTPTSACMSSTARDSSPRNTKHGSSMAMMPENQMTLSPSKHSGRTQSKLLRLPPSLQVSMDTAWLQPTTMHRHNLSWIQR
jgi:hypothetical protein